MLYDFRGYEIFGILILCNIISNRGEPSDLHQDFSARSFCRSDEYALASEFQCPLPPLHDPFPSQYKNICLRALHFHHFVSSIQQFIQQNSEETTAANKSGSSLLVSSFCLFSPNPIPFPSFIILLSFPLFLSLLNFEPSPLLPHFPFSPLLHLHSTVPDSLSIDRLIFLAYFSCFSSFQSVKSLIYLHSSNSVICTMKTMNDCRIHSETGNNHSARVQHQRPTALPSDQEGLPQNRMQNYIM